jgi:alkylation response protein AidB-like acyl-CoA dehydrogenase
MSTATAPQVEGLIERAKALVPMLRESAEATERARRPPPEHFEALSEAGIFRMCAPRRFGGYEADFQTQSDVLSELARGCPSTSWVATILSALAWVAAVYPDEAQAEVFGDGDPRVSCVFSPTGTAVPKDGGFVLSGRWGYNTGGTGSEWVILNAIVPSEDGEGMPMTMLVRSSEVTNLDDWQATGMAGTGSNTIVAENVFVPSYRCIPLPDLIEAAYPASESSGNPYFGFPTASVLIVNAGGTPVGIARGALEAFLERLPGRAITYTDYTSQAEAPVTHLLVGEAALKIESADDHVRRACTILDTHPGGPLSREARIRCRVHIAYATQLAREAVDTLFSISGASSIQSNVPIQRFQRDMQALSNHGLMSSITTNELFGRFLCGLEPNTQVY